MRRHGPVILRGCRSKDPALGEACWELLLSAGEHCADCEGSELAVAALQSFANRFELPVDDVCIVISDRLELDGERTKEELWRAFCNEIPFDF